MLLPRTQASQYDVRRGCEGNDGKRARVLAREFQAANKKRSKFSARERENSQQLFRDCVYVQQARYYFTF